MSGVFGSIDEAPRALKRAGYLPNEETITSIFLAERLGKPLLIEGPAGTGKTELGRATAQALGRRLVRLQCYEGLDESKVLYEWNYRRQLLSLQAAKDRPGAGDLDDIFSEDFLLERPLLDAIRSEEPVVLLIDEVDRIEMETEALLLEVLSDFQVTIPELGTVAARSRPITILTSNATRELSEALKRRCLYLWLDYPTLERERAIVMSRVPQAGEQLADQIVRIVRSLRALDLKKAPSIAETLDWTRTLLELGVDKVDAEIASRTVGSLLKSPADIKKARAERFGDS
ncbi:MAG: MoxR family ATPase [Actinobacteria bacterium]|nr:MoxR family ATPase [Actinomycetota bacterium]